MIIIRMITTTTFSFVDEKMNGLLHRRQEYVSTSILTVGAICFVILLSCILKFSLEFVYLSLIECDISAVI
jgi:hypothetical protein